MGRARGIWQLLLDIINKVAQYANLVMLNDCLALYLKTGNLLVFYSLKQDSTVMLPLQSIGPLGRCFL